MPIKLCNMSENEPVKNLLSLPELMLVIIYVFI